MSKKVKIGNIAIGNGEKIAIQSMLSVPSYDVLGNVKQAQILEKAGCDIIRVAVPDMPAVQNIAALKMAVKMPVVADIHFDYKLALASIEAGADKIRINPGNIGKDEYVKEVAGECKLKHIPIRIGVNSGSVEKHILEKYGYPSAEAMVESAAYHANLLEKYGFSDIVISLKSSNLKTMMSAYRLASKELPYPLHLGVTEAGTAHMGLIKSAIGIGSLLADGIGDTIRVSLTADPIEEIKAAKDILKAVGAKGSGVNIVSCPTCGRTRINLISLAKEVENKLADEKLDITVAVMGCAVNGPGEAKEADYGIAGGDGEGLVFKKGQIIKKVSEKDLVNELIALIKKDNG